jgi:hypothetical protein
VRRAIYVETFIRAETDRVWELTQDTELHPRWDLRFTSITPTGTTAEGAARFRCLRAPPSTKLTSDVLVVHRRGDWQPVLGQHSAGGLDTPPKAAVDAVAGVLWDECHDPRELLERGREAG